MGAKTVYPVELAPSSSIKFEGQSGYGIIRSKWEEDFPIKVTNLISNYD